ncbi:MAG: hypothetical protein H8E10_11420 [Desulfobacterales bacterium]|nr:hypothetical protein [Desulfobacterales bacterium]MBL7101185.1 hypothetical protein [Desulfobacteraceae bacterium]MBL7171721.1 hypothetical protein [Desulfobacteraceae bacterium]
MTHKRPLQSFLPRAFLLVVALFFLLGPVSSCSVGTVSVDQGAVPEEKYQTLVARWGVRPVAIRLTGADYFVDFRYVIVDPEKAKTVLSRGKQNKDVFLLDQKTGKKFPVPVTKVGPLRATTLSPKKDRQYTILFSNVGKSIKKGGKVSVIIGEFKAENLTVE